MHAASGPAIETKSRLLRLAVSVHTIGGTLLQDFEEDDFDEADDCSDEDEDEETGVPSKQNQLPFGQQYGFAPALQDGDDPAQADERILERRELGSDEKLLEAGMQ